MATPPEEDSRPPIPPTVAIAAAMVILRAAGTAIETVAVSSWEGEQAFQMLGLLSFNLLIYVVPMLYAYSGKNWARCLVAVIILGSYLILLTPHADLQALESGWYPLAYMFLDVSVLVLLFVPKSNRWFKPE